MTFADLALLRSRNDVDGRLSAGLRYSTLWSAWRSFGHAPRSERPHDHRGRVACEQDGTRHPRQLWEQMPLEPKWVISMGACAYIRRPFSITTRWCKSVNQVIPASISMSTGCPPRPEQLIYSITLLQEKIQKERGTIRKALNLA